MNSGPNRRQPTRSVRNTISRPSNYYARPFGIPPGPEPVVESTPGFFPAIQHFTDAISALPKETVRHLTLLKETEGKAYQPEQAITELLTAIDALPPPPRSLSQSHLQTYIGLSLTNSLNGSVAGSVVDGTIPRSNQPLTESIDHIPPSQIVDEHSEARYELFRRLHASLREGAQVLDEKNTIFYAANEALSRQLERLDDVIPHVSGEVSEEARLGSNTHWALPHMKELRRGAGTAERQRRDVLATNSLAAAAAAVHETDIAATRSEARREAMLAKRHRNQNFDSDFEDRAPSRRPNNAPKVRRGQDGEPKARNTANTTQPNKRRRVEKGTAAASDRQPATNSSRIIGPTPIEGSAAEVGRKKPKALVTQGAARKSRNIGNSPSLASSPTRGTFSTALNKDFSPAPIPQRPNQARGRQNSVQSNLQDNTRNRPSSGHKGVNGVSAGTPELKSLSNATGRALPEARAGVRDVYNVNDERLVEADGVQGALAVKNSAPSTGNAMKREDTEPVEVDTSSIRGGPGSASLIRSRGGSRGSKPTTPVDTASAEPPPATQASRSRSTRGLNNGNTASSPPHRGATSPKRPHKKSAAALAAAAAAAESAGSSADEDSYEQGDADATEIVEEGMDDDEPVFCVCKQPSYGEMVACDNRKCPTEWFHLGCVGLTRPPGSKTKWYCEECRELMKQKREGR